MRYISRTKFESWPGWETLIYTSVWCQTLFTLMSISVRLTHLLAHRNKQMQYNINIICTFYNINIKRIIYIVTIMCPFRFEKSFCLLIFYTSKRFLNFYIVWLISVVFDTWRSDSTDIACNFHASYIFLNSNEKRIKQLSTRQRIHYNVLNVIFVQLFFFHRK
jgi:hypothetical protein